MTVGLGGESDTLGYSLEVLDGTPEVDATHRLDEDGESLAARDCWNHKTFLVFHTINLANILAVDKHLSVVVTVVQRQERR